MRVLRSTKDLQPRVAKASIPEPVIAQKAVTLESVPEVPTTVRRAKKPKLKPIPIIPEPVTVPLKTLAKKQAQRVLQAHAAQQDLFARVT